jgi:hypothetical protein
MTYPPQPPGPPGPYNQGPYGQDPYQQGPPGQTPWAQGPQGGFPPVGPPPPKRRTGLIATLIIVAIMVIGGGGVGLYLYLSKDDRRGSGSGGDGDTGPRAAAQTFVRELEKAGNAKTVQDIDISPLEPVTCADDYAKLTDEVQDTKQSQQSARPNDQQVRLRMKDFKETGDGATFTMTTRLTAGDGEESSVQLSVGKESGDWKVCGLYEGDPGGVNPTEDGDPSGGPTDAPGSEDGDPPASGEVPPNPFPSPTG